MTPQIKIIHIDSTGSTNDYIRQYREECLTNHDPQRYIVVVAEEQTAGRGSGKNTWESEREKNLTFSIIFRPQAVLPAEQYILSMAIAVAVREAVEQIVFPLEGTPITVKWPNDIFIADEKVCGILMECSIRNNAIDHCIIGVGLNVNQRSFVSDAPNPTSICLHTDAETDREELLSDIISRFCQQLDAIASGHSPDMRMLYRSHLYRRQGTWTFEDGEGRFEATIKEVADDGHLVLVRSDGQTKSYDFHTVKFII
ncbi:MAG: biotin--[acetyl-CoA-carboxylase] ligase [Prevotella sp.]|nr:biotin--[acetyl-CoA-carboxylase] ligase [Prevotella sp.]